MCKESNIPCLKLDGTDGITCQDKGAYRWKSGQPSKSRITNGDYHDSMGHHKGRHLRCIPAEEFLHLSISAQAESPSELTPKYANQLLVNMVRSQKKCSKFQERK